MLIRGTARQVRCFCQLFEMV